MTMPTKFKKSKKKGKERKTNFAENLFRKTFINDFIIT